MLFKQLADKIIRNQKFIGDGGVNFLPLYPIFPRLKSFLPGFIRGDQILITGGTGAGKSRLGFFIASYLLSLSQTIPNIKIKIFYNSLEEPVEKFKAMFVINYLREKHNIRLSYYEIMGYWDKQFPTEYHPYIIEAADYFTSTIEPYFEVVQIPHPTGFYKLVREFLVKNGTYYFNGVPANQGEMWDEYRASDPNQWVITFSDHIGNYLNESGKSWYETLEHFSAQYTRQRLGLKCGVVSFFVQQQVPSKEALEVNIKGKTIIDKLKPSIDGLNKIKTTSQDATIILGLFYPFKWRDHIPAAMYLGYDLKLWKNNLRTLILLKSREGVLDDLEMAVLFDGSRNYFAHLDKDDMDSNEKLLKQVTNV